MVGPDGQRYPTWHAPLAVDPATGAECAFGHEHGRDPRGSQLWKTRQVQRAFYFDANVNGRMDPDEEAWAGLPFGYANSQSDVWFTEQKITTMRHEDHNGHKVEWANDETDIKTHGMSQVKDAGVWMGKNGDGVVKADTGMRCFFLGKVHQGVSTPDAFRHNLHEVMFFQDCRHKDDLARCVDAHDLSTCPDTNSKNARRVADHAPSLRRQRRLHQLRAAVRRGTPARPRRTAWRPATATTRRPIRQGTATARSRRGPVSSGASWSTPASPATPMKRGRPASACGPPAAGRWCEGPDLLFDVNDSVRYYYPEALKARRGYAERHPELAGTDLGYMQDVCSESLDSRRARHNLCDLPPPPATWPTSRGTIRGRASGD